MSEISDEYYKMMERTGELMYKNHELEGRLLDLQGAVAKLREENEALKSRLARAHYESREHIEEHDRDDRFDH